MNNYCRNYGQKLEKKDKKCKNCNTEVYDLRVIDVNMDYKTLMEIKEKEKKYTIAAAIPFSIAVFCNFILYRWIPQVTYLVPLLILLSYLIILSGKTKINKNQEIKAVYKKTLFMFYSQH